MNRSSSMIAALMLALVAIALPGCTTQGGANWWTADFNKYDKNYADFPTSQIRIGQSKDALTSLLGEDYAVIEATAEYEILAYEKWAAPAGPDYVESRLLLRMEKEKLVRWTVTDESVEVVRRSW